MRKRTVCCIFIVKRKLTKSRACLKNHSCSLHALLCVRFCPHSIDAALIQTKSSTNCDGHLTESIFQTRSRAIDANAADGNLHKLFDEISMIPYTGSKSMIIFIIKYPETKCKKRRFFYEKAFGLHEKLPQGNHSGSAV